MIQIAPSKLHGENEIGNMTDNFRQIGIIGCLFICLKAERESSGKLMI
jgi:hypothetical protein